MTVKIFTNKVHEPLTEELNSLRVTDPILYFFAFEHLPAKLSHISVFFARLAVEMVKLLPRNEEREVMLRKLLEAKDCAVRAALDSPGMDSCLDQVP